MFLNCLFFKVFCYAKEADKAVETCFIEIFELDPRTEVFEVMGESFPCLMGGVCPLTVPWSFMNSSSRSHIQRSVRQQS